MFGRATIRLGIGPHSSLVFDWQVMNLEYLIQICDLGMGIGHLGSRVESTLGNLAEKLYFSSSVSTRRAPNNSTHFTSGTHTSMPLPTLPVPLNLKPQSGRVLHVAVCLKLTIIPTPQFSHSGTVV